MGRSLMQTYALIVCFSTLMCLVVALGIALYDAVQIAAPGFTVQQSPAWQSDESFLVYHPHMKDRPAQEVARLRENERSYALVEERRAATQSLVFTSIIVFIDAVVYAIHWWLAKKFDIRLSAA